jgi:hypothetical protein
MLTALIGLRVQEEPKCRGGAARPEVLVRLCIGQCGFSEVLCAVPLRSLHASTSSNPQSRHALTPPSTKARGVWVR